MKNLMILIGACIFAINVSAQTADTKDGMKKMHAEKYCAKMKDGKMMVMHGTHQIMADTTLVSGAMIKTDGTVTKKDGTTWKLKNGDCADANGGMMEHKMGTKKSTKAK